MFSVKQNKKTHSDSLVIKIIAYPLFRGIKRITMTNLTRQLSNSPS